MTHQTVDSTVILYGRPKRDTIIQKDDIVSLKIDCNLLSVDEFIDKYCSKTFSGERIPE